MSVEVKQEPEEGAADEDTNWPDLKVRKMLTLYLAYIDDFRDKKCKKKEIWKRIADQVGNSVDACDRKFRNLKMYYVNILRKKKAGKLTFTTWPYYEIYQEIFGWEREQWNETAQYPGGEEEPKAEEKKRKRVVYNHEQRPLLKVLKQRRMESANRMVQESIDKKLGSLIEQMEESNRIQRERNEIMEKYLQQLLARSSENPDEDPVWMVSNLT